MRVLCEGRMSPHAYLGTPSVNVDQFCAKKVFSTRRIALKVIGLSRKDLDRPVAHGGNSAMKPWFCVYCDGWHIAHRMRKKAKA